METAHHPCSLCIQRPSRGHRHRPCLVAVDDFVTEELRQNGSLKRLTIIQSVAMTIYARLCNIGHFVCYICFQSVAWCHLGFSGHSIVGLSFICIICSALSSFHFIHPDPISPYLISQAATSDLMSKRFILIIHLHHSSSSFGLFARSLRIASQQKYTHRVLSLPDNMYYVWRNHC